MKKFNPCLQFMNSFGMFLTTLLIFFFTGCVGTIEDTAIQNTKTSSTKVQLLPFNGLVDAKAISHDKVEVYFFAATGTAASITYEIYVNNTKTPIFVSGSSLTPNALGQLVFTVTGLQVNTTYSFSVSARNNETGAKSDEGTSKYATTFSNTTADFNGVSSLRLPQGIGGQNSVVVEWVPALTLGSPTGAKVGDPVAYEITYISEDGGISNLNNSGYTGTDRVVSTIPSTLPANPPPSSERNRQINGLVSGKKYFFQVRAIHKGYVEYGPPNGDPGYKRELNNRVLSITTAVPTGAFDFSPESVKALNPPGVDALTNLDIKWNSAEGDFYNYRVFIKAVADSNVPDALLAADINTLGSPCVVPACRIVDADKSFVRIEALAAYRVFQIKVVACENASCGENDRIVSNLVIGRTHPSLAPFEGVYSIDHPRSVAEAASGSVHLMFNSPVVTAGYLTDLKVYCYDGPNDLAPRELVNGVPDAGAGPCNGLTRVTASPGSTNAYATFDEITINNTVPNSGDEYCFSVFPVIDGDNTAEFVDINPLSSALVKCIVPVKKVPTIDQFPGRTAACTVNGTSLTVSWATPTAGMYTNFAVFWKESGGYPFKFSEAIQNDGPPLGADPTDAGGKVYNRTYGLASGATSYQITNLIPGKRYNVGVLAYLFDGTSNTYSEFNLNTGSCLIPIPKAEFDEWTHILSVGPKVNGLAPYKSDLSPMYIPETLDVDRLPVEVLLSRLDPEGDLPAAGALPDGTYYLGDLSSATQFNGVFGALNGDNATFPLYRYSNRGIIHLEWKDVNFYDGTFAMRDFINTYEAADPGKTLRRYGYKVYRSHNGKVTWTDLTSSNSSSFQTSSNSGLLRTPATTRSWRRRNNEAPKTDYILSFTDYSVLNLHVEDDLTEKARTYYYKIVPFIDNIPIEFEDESNIIKVILPPPNMALVHRKIANRVMCKELETDAEPRDLDKSPTGHYSCEFYGLGARSLKIPAFADEMVLDLGGDLLVDRFEVGCNWTRGDGGGTSNSSYDGRQLANFQGLSSTAGAPYSLPGGAGGGVFRGCVGYSDDGEYQYEPGIRAGIPNVTVGEYPISEEGGREDLKAWRVRPGDCFGSHQMNIAPGECPLDSESTDYPYGFPGANPSMNYNCEAGADEHVQNLSNLDDESHSEHFVNYYTQSEYAAVFYNRYRSPGYGITQWRGSDSPDVDSDLDAITTYGNLRTHGNCFINLPYVKSDSKWRARWFSINKLFKDELYHDGNTFTLWDKTVDQILSSSIETRNATGTIVSPAYNPLYDGTDVKAPDPSQIVPGLRYKKNTTKLARIMASNSAKLPPLGYLAQEDMDNICSTFTVQLGTYDDTTETFSPDEPPKPKRLPRKKEFNFMASWPDTLTEAQVTAIESGSFLGPRINNNGIMEREGCNVSAKSTAMGGATGQTFSNDFITIDWPHVWSNNPYVLTGSSPADPAVSNPQTYYTPPLPDSPSTWGLISHDHATEKCMSRYGIQDLVGNVAEVVSDQVFCDFSGDELWISPPDPSDIEKQKQGVRASQFSIPYLYNHGGGDPYNPANLLYWVLHTGTTGNCSVVESGASRTGSYGSYPQVVSIFNPDDSTGYNSGIIHVFKDYDQAGIEDARNSDGYFLDFGQNNLGGPIGVNNTMSIAATAVDNRRSKYWNPVLGIPLECGGVACSTTVTPDNLNYTLTPWVSKFSLNAGNYIISNFPTNNAQIYNDGIGELQVPYLRYSLPFVPPGNRPADQAYLHAVNGQGDSSPTGDTVDVRTFDADNDTLQLYSIAWVVTRGSPLQFLVGGSSTSTDAGRYSFHMRGYGRYNEREGFSNGFRCMVKVNQYE